MNASPSPLPLYAVAAVRGAEQAAFAAGLSSLDLMERAGIALCDVLLREWPRARRVLVVCGPGNNGGDGWVAARHLAAAGLDVRCVALGDTTTGDAGHMRARWQAAGGIVLSPVAVDFSEAEVIVDALFGIGLSRAPEGEGAALIAAINASGRPVLAADVPSGVDADRGQAPGLAVRATRTLSFIASKAGLHTGAALDHVGATELATLDFPGEALGAFPPLAERLESLSTLPPRARNAHKGDYGFLLVLGGNHGMAGAARMAGEAALRVGAGRVAVVTRADQAGTLGMGCPELMVHGVEDERGLLRLLAQASAVAIGPGLGRDAWATLLWRHVRALDVPRVIDADALAFLGHHGHREGAGERVLTPHPGEAARLLDTDARTVQADRYQAVQALRARYGGTVVLKGAGTLVCDETLSVCPDGNPGMASAGMGDVLTGVIAGLLAQGLSAAAAARLGVCLHARAGDWLAARQGGRGLLASDLLPVVRALLNGVSP